MKFLAMKFSSSSLFHDVEVCLSRMDLVSTALAADEDVQLSDAARSAMIDIIADCSDLVKYMADRLSVIAWRIRLNSAGLLFAAGLL